MEVAIIFNYGHYVVIAIFAALLASMFGAFIFFAMRGSKIEREAAAAQASSDHLTMQHPFNRSTSQRSQLPR